MMGFSYPVLRANDLRGLAVSTARPIVATTYCSELHNAANREGVKIGYNFNEYGWSYDVFLFHGAIVVGGYRFPRLKKYEYSTARTVDELLTIVNNTNGVYAEEVNI